MAGPSTHCRAPLFRPARAQRILYLAGTVWDIACRVHGVVASTLGGCPAGAGRKIIRCEVSLDGAKSWQLADIHRACAPNAYGKHWAWVHWELRIPICKPSHAGRSHIQLWPSLFAAGYRCAACLSTTTLLSYTCTSCKQVHISPGSCCTPDAGL